MSVLKRLALEMVRTNLGTTEVRARDGIRRVRQALDDLERFIDSDDDVFDTACNGARALGEVYVDCSRAATFRTILAIAETDEGEA